MIQILYTLRKMWIIFCIFSSLSRGLRSINVSNLKYSYNILVYGLVCGLIILGDWLSWLTVGVYLTS